MGRYPLLINVLNLATRYHMRVRSLDSNSLVKLSCNDQSILDYEGSWTSIMDKLYMHFHGTQSLKEVLEKLYSEKWLFYINSCRSKGKLSVYSNLKNSFKLENYLLQFPIWYRRNFTKLRISAHNLAIETGRYSKPIETPPNKRLCFHCKEIETEIHFILNCSLYQTERKSLYDKLSTFISIDSVSSDELFYLLISGLQGDLEVGQTICNFVNECFKIRNESLSCKKETDILQRANTTTTRSGRISKRAEIFDL